MTQLILPTYQAGQLVTVQRWLSTLGHGAIEEHPPLAVLAGWIAVLTGETAEAQRWAAFLDTASFDQVPVDGTASFNSARAMLRALMCAAGPEQMATDASFGRRRGTAMEPMARLGADRVRRGAAAPRRPCPGGRAPQGDRCRRGCTRQCRRSCAQQVRARAVGDGSTADGLRRPNICSVALATVEESRLHDYALSVLAFAAAARLAAHRGDQKEVDRQLAQAMRARPSCTFAIPYLAVRVRLQLAKVYTAIADQSTARHLLREIDDIVLHRPALGTLVDEVAQFRTLLTQTAQVTVAGGTPLTPAELRLLPYLQTHLTFREIGQRLFVSRNTVSSEVGLDLPETGRLLPQRRRATRDHRRPARG